MFYLKNGKRHWIIHIIGAVIICLTCIYFLLSFFNINQNPFFAKASTSPLIRFEIVLTCMIVFDVALFTLWLALVIFLIMFCTNRLSYCVFKRGGRSYFPFLTFALALFWMVNILIKDNWHYDIPQIISTSVIYNGLSNHFLFNWIAVFFLWFVTMIFVGAVYLNHYFSRYIIFNYSYQLATAAESTINNDDEYLEIVLCKRHVHIFQLISWMVTQLSMVIKFLSCLRFWIIVFLLYKRLLCFARLARLFAVEPLLLV